MIFNALMEAVSRGELILVDGGLCHFHRRRDGVVTIREIIVLPESQRLGIGRAMIDEVVRRTAPVALCARCPADLPANAWYERMGFEKTHQFRSRSGREVIEWTLRV